MDSPASNLHPSSAQLDQLMALNDDTGPLFMINMLRFREQAAYREESGQPPCSGAEAYQRYGAETGPIVERLGGKVRLLMGIELSFIAPDTEQWDKMLIVEWPNLAAFKALLTDHAYQAIGFHRGAALADSRLLISSQEFNGFIEK